MIDHVSAFAIDALALGALDDETRARVENHLAGCAACRRERDQAAAQRAAFTGSVLPRTLPALRARLAGPRRPARRAMWLGGAVAAAAAVVAVVIAARPPREPPGQRELGIKGGPAWLVVGHRADRTFQIRNGEALAPGDALRFVIVPDRALYLLIASIDGAGVASIYFPYGGARSERVDGSRIELPGSIVLDAAPGPERLFAIFSDEPLDAAPVAAQLRELGAQGADAIRTTAELAVAARAQLSLVFEKTAP